VEEIKQNSTEIQSCSDRRAALSKQIQYYTKELNFYKELLEKNHIEEDFEKLANFVNTLDVPKGEYKSWTWTSNRVIQYQNELRTVRLEVSGDGITMVVKDKITEDVTLQYEVLCKDTHYFYAKVAQVLRWYHGMEQI
jgi:hypothetical protein